MDKKTSQKIENYISTTLADNVAFAFFHVMETFSKYFLEVHGLKSRVFQLLLHELQHCAQNLKKEVQLYLLNKARNSRRMRMWSICCLDLTARNQ